MSSPKTQDTSPAEESELFDLQMIAAAYEVIKRDLQKDPSIKDPEQEAADILIRRIKGVIERHEDETRNKNHEA